MLSAVGKIINTPSDSNLVVIQTKSFRFSRYEFISVYYTCFARSRTCLDIQSIVLSFVLSLLSYLQFNQAERLTKSLHRKTNNHFNFSDNFETMLMQACFTYKATRFIPSLNRKMVSRKHAIQLGKM